MSAWNAFGWGVVAGIWLLVLVEQVRSLRTPPAKPAPPVTVSGIEDLEATEGCVRFVTINGHRFLAIDDMTRTLNEYADRTDALGQHDRARQARHIRDHFAIASMDLDLEPDVPATRPKNGETR